MPEEETLAQRLKRLRDSKNDRRSGSFGDGGLDLSFSVKIPPTPVPEEETLGQRKKRLRQEEERKRLNEEAKTVQAEVRKRQSMATILQQSYAYPQQQQHQMLGTGMMGRSMPILDGRPGSMGADMVRGGNSGLIHQAGVATLRPQMSMGNINMARQSMYGMNSMGIQAPNGMGMGGMPLQVMGVAGGAMPMSPQEIAANNKQREMVERWRASVM